MRLFNIVGIIIMLTLCASAMATEHKQMTNKHAAFTKIFSSKSNASAFKFANYSDESLLNPSRNILDDKKGSFQFQAENDSYFKLLVHGESYFHKNEKNEHRYSHSLMEMNDEHEGHGQGHGGWGYEDGDHGGIGHGDDDHGDRDYDDIKSPVPEPGSYALLLAGLLMLSVIKRRKT